MSEEFEVKGPHEEILEGGGEKPGHHPHGFNSRLAVMTAIMASLGALLSYQASLTLGEAIISKNEASIKNTEAADQWNFYQAKSNKQNLAELAAKLTGGQERDDSRKESARYADEKAAIQTKALELEQLAHEADLRSERYLNSHHRWATGTTALQIAISLAAIALLTRRGWLEFASLACAAVGVGFGALAWLGM